MPDHSPTPRPSWRSAALGAVGGLMVLLPLGEVLRHQVQDIQALAAERAMLDPLSQAVAVQRGLLSHSDLCQRLLAGRTQLEPERMLRQAVVDTALWDLKNTLSVGLWVPALGEAGQLTLDWRNLILRIQTRSLDTRTSHAEHRLLIEQTLQVMDLVTAAAPSTSSPYLLALRQAAIDATLIGANGAANGASNSSSNGSSNGTSNGTPGGISNADRDSQRAQALSLSLAQVQDQLQAHSQALDQRLTRLQTTRAWLFTLAAGLLLLAAAGLLWWRKRGSPSPPPPASQDGIRLGLGRRATDADRAPNATSRLLWQLRQGPSRTAASYSDTLPPAP